MESISIFEIIKIGIGPSSSHTMGPWRAALFMLEYIDDQVGLEQLVRIRVELYGSLAKTGHGHGTDLAAVMGLTGRHYRVIDTTTLQDQFEEIQRSKEILIHLSRGKEHSIDFDIAEDLHFNFSEELPDHPNGIRFVAYLQDGSHLFRDYYSIGGGFVMTKDSVAVAKKPITTPFPCHRASDVLKYCQSENLTFPQLVFRNELAWRAEALVNQRIDELADEMLDCIWRGLNATGMLPGALNVKRRASDMYDKLFVGQQCHTIQELTASIRSQEWSFGQINQWVSCFALAVNEENATFGRVVTAPTNGAAGVIPAVLMYAICFEGRHDFRDVRDYILVAGEVGTLFKKGATISAAMGGCQAEIGVSSAMAAAGLTAVLSGTTAQCLMAAEIAMEHHLGLTCDPVKGLVQIPCIERNAMGAIKAITASQLALSSDPYHARVSLDEVIATMLHTAKDMNTKYKETSEGGLAVSVNLPEC